MKEKSKTTGSIHSSVTPFSLRLAALLLLALLPHLRSIGETETDHWAFLPPRKSSLPGAINPIDHFVHERLKKAGLSPSSRAPSHTLIRRLSFDLRGIPPTQEEVNRFRSDTSPGAWSQLVERFLASPHFGERLAQNWLDLARYADTSGYAADRTRNMWAYRDWVINSINLSLIHI